MEEIWKEIDSVPSCKVSNKGEVYSKKMNRLCKLCIDNSNGYVVVRLPDANGVSHKMYVHRLVAEAFLPNPEHKRTINHIDCNKTNNDISNLEWATDSENMKHAFENGLCENTRLTAYTQAKSFDTMQKHIVHKQQKTDPDQFLYDFQLDAVGRMFNGCILNGGTGSGKSRTGLFYWFKECGGWIDRNHYTPMNKPCDLYIITTAKKRNDLEWEGELSNLLLSTNPKKNAVNGEINIVIDSWQNIKKYADVKNAQFILDEDKVCGNGVWVKAFLKIAKNNNWFILSATAGDRWTDYIAVFIANGFYKNKSEFINEHVQYARYTKYPKIERYYNTGRLIRLRDKILIDMDFERHTVQHHEDVYVTYNIQKYKEAIKTRWDPYKNEPIQQASGLCYILRRIVNEDDSRQTALLEIFEKHPKLIVFYNFDHELNVLKNLYYGENVEVAEYNGHKHQPIPDNSSWVYLVQYTAGCEGFNCISTDTIVFYSQNYSYKVMEQATGRIDRLNTPYTDLYYYHLKTRSGIDVAIYKALKDKKQFNERRFVKWDKPNA